MLELALSILYLGEGAKRGSASLGSSDPLILLFTIKAVENIYGIPKWKIKAELHIRQDQNGIDLMKHWSNTLNIPVQNFSFVTYKRPIKSKTYETYKGVCVLRFGGFAIQRRLVFLSRGFCNKISNTDD